MTLADYTAMVEEVRRARGTTVEVSGRRLPSSVAEIERKLAGETDASRRQMLYSIYYRECSELDRQDLEIEARRREVEEFAGEPVPMVGLAIALADSQEGAGGAPEAVARAVAAAVRKGEFINYALLAQVRIALRNRSFETLESALCSLIEFHQGPPRPDCGLETDFLSSIPDGAISRTTIEEYKRAALTR